MKTLEINRKGVTDFGQAYKLAWDAAHSRLGSEAVLWSWNDAETGRHSPPVECCDEERRPAWKVYGETRGANLKVSVEEGRYEFLFGPPPF